LLKRGFKAQCERRTIEVRKQLELTERDPLKALTLAKHLNVDVKSALEIPGVSDQDIKQLVNVDPEGWSAFTIKIKEQHLIVFNPSQSPGRLNSVIMHELSHITLGHELAGGHTTEQGLFFANHYNQDQEHEADWLGSALLLPRPALMHIRKSNWSNNAACDYYQTSLDMLVYRFRVTGVDAQLHNSQKKKI